MKRFLTSAYKKTACPDTPKNHVRTKHTIWCMVCICLTVWLSGCRPDDGQAELFYKEAWRHRLAMQFDSTIFYVTKAEDALNRHTPPLLRAKVYFTKGGMFEVTQNYELAKEYLEKAVKYYRKADNHAMESYVLTRMALNHYMITEDRQEAMRYVRQAEAVAPNDTLLGMACQLTGFLFRREGMHDSARFYLRKSLAYPYYRDELSSRLMSLANSFFATNQLDSSEYYALKSLDFPGSDYQRRGSYQRLYEIALQRGDTCAIAHYSQLYSQQIYATSDIEGGLNKKLQDVQQEKIENLTTRQNRSLGWLFVAGGLVILLGGGVWLTLNASQRHKRRAENTLAENESLSVQNKQLAGENEKLIARNRQLQMELEQEKRQRETYVELKHDLLQSYKTARNRDLERRRQQLKERLDSVCEQAEKYPLLSPGYKAVIRRAYAQVLHWDEPVRCLELFNSQFDCFADKAEHWCSGRRSAQHAAARLCCLFLVDTMKTHVEILMDYKEGSYERTVKRLLQKTGTHTEQDFRMGLYKVAFLDTEQTFPGSRK